MDPRDHHFDRSTRCLSRLVLALGIALGTACSHVSGPYVWVNNYAASQPASDAYSIGIGDLLNVQVWDNDQMSTHTRVRSDGRISVPLVNDVDVAGKAPKELARELERVLKDGHFVLNPRVNVVVEESRPIVIPVLGGVARPGNYPLDPGAGIAVALASAGGLTDFAHQDRIFVVRKTPTPVRIRFSMSGITSAVGRAPTFRLQSGDVIFVQ